MRGGNKMAVKEIIRSTIRAKLVTGHDDMTGKTLYGYRTFNNLKTSSDPSDVLDSIVDLMSLQKHKPFNFEQIDYGELSSS